MNLYEKATNVASEILWNQLLPACALHQTNPQRAGSMNLMHEALRKAFDDLHAHDMSYPAQHGFGPSRLMKAVGIVEQLRQMVDYGVFKDFRDPPYRLDETPEWRTKVRLIESRVNDALLTADALAAPDPRTALEKIRDHVKSAEAIWDEMPRDEQDTLSDRQNVNEDTSLRHCLHWGAQHAEHMVELSQQSEARPA